MKTALGLHKCKSFFVAAAPISIETLEYFLSLDIRIFDIYGMSECSGPQTFNCTEEQRVGSIGKGLPGCSTRLAVKEDPDWYYIHIFITSLLDSAHNFLVGCILQKRSLLYK